MIIGFCKKCFEAVWHRTIWVLFNKKEQNSARKRIKNDQFSLITQNCVGGVIYKLLGKRFDSPTINTYIYQKDFCKFCADIKYYLNCELVFFQNDSDTRCPYAYLGDGDKRITIQFTHYHNEEEARNKWNERKERIHWDNLYIMTNDGNNAELCDFNLLERVPCKRKVIFTSKCRPEIADSFELYAMNGQETAV